jgi:hypothetical protein
MSDFLRVNSVAYYEDKNGINTILGAGSAVAIGSNTVLIAGTSGKIIRVMGFTLQSQTTTNALVYFLNGSGGATRSLYYVPGTNQAPYLQAIADSGYFECSSGTDLCVTVSGAAALINVYYYRYAG